MARMIHPPQHHSPWAQDSENWGGDPFVHQPNSTKLCPEWRRDQECFGHLVLLLPVGDKAPGNPVAEEDGQIGAGGCLCVCGPQGLPRWSHLDTRSPFFPARPSNKMTNSPISGIFLSTKRFLRAEQGRGRKVREEENLTTLRRRPKPRRYLSHCSKKNH